MVACLMRIPARMRDSPHPMRENRNSAPRVVRRAAGRGVDPVESTLRKTVTGSLRERASQPPSLIISHDSALGGAARVCGQPTVSISVITDTPRARARSLSSLLDYEPLHLVEEDAQSA